MSINWLQNDEYGDYSNSFKKMNKITVYLKGEIFK